MVEGNAFAYACTLESVTPSKSIGVINAGAFEECISLRSFIVPDGVTYIGSDAFSNCLSLQSIRIPESVEEIGESAFANNNGVVIFGQEGSAAQDYAEENGLGFWPDGATKMTGTCGRSIKWTLTKASALTVTGTGKIDPKSYPKGSSYPEWHKYSNIISKLSIGNGITAIGDFAFIDCIALKSVVIPASVESVGYHALRGCPELEQIAFPAGIKSIDGLLLGDRAWYADIFERAGKQLKQITVRGYADSPAEEFAAGAGCRFVSLGSVVKASKTRLTSVASLAKGIALKWTEAPGAAGYYIYRKVGSGALKKVKTVKGASTLAWTDKAATKNGAKYTYAVKAYKGSAVGGAESKATVFLSRPAASKPANSASRTLSISWKGNAKAGGYEVAYARNAKFTASAGVKTISRKSTVKASIGKLAKGKTYYVRVRAYKTVSGAKVYSAWSAVQKVKIAR